MSKKSRCLTVSLVVVLSSLSAMGALIYRHYGPATASAKTVEATELPSTAFEENWMGLYMNGEKIGYSMSLLEPAAGGYRLTEALTMRLKVMGTEKEVKTRIEAALGRDLALMSFDSKMTSDFVMGVKGRVEGKLLHITLESAGGNQSRTIPIERPPSLESAFMLGVAGAGMLEVGRKYAMPVLDPATMSLSEMTMEVMERGPFKWMGREVQAYRLKGSLKGVELSVWAGEDGTVIREETSVGLVLVKEAKEDAMRLDRPSFDIITGLSVPFDMTLPAEPSCLKVRLRGVDMDGLELDGGRQRLTGDVLEITRERLPLEARNGPAASGEHLEETLTVQSKDPAIVSTAQEIVKGMEGSLEKARALYEWVYRNISKTNVVGIPSAVEVLKARRGDCNEHTVLYTALARAAGLPARMAAGLVYQKGMFYYHAWPEVFLGEWVAVDPALGQFPADASHIRLVTGDLERQMRLLPLIGNIRFEGVEAR